jgi:hypothetical protein
MAKLVSSGKCQLCQAVFKKPSMSRHLTKCLTEHPETHDRASPGHPQRLFHLVIESGPAYWLHVEMPSSAQLADLDDFLRRVWLECCGHLSAFRIEGTSYSSHPDNSWGEEGSMTVPLSKVLRPGLKFSHEYDFGSTTHLTLRVVGERQGPWPNKGKVRLLARNEPPDIRCGECGAAATRINTQDAWEPSGWLCDACAANLKEEEEYFLPVVNSPRTGVCGYTGPG